MLGFILFLVFLVIVLVLVIGFILENNTNKKKLKETEEMLKRAFKEVLNDIKDNDKK